MHRPPRPKSVDTAFLLFMISAGLGILSSIFSFITAKEAAEAALKPLRDAGFDTSAAAVEPSYGGAIFSLILFAVWIAVVFQMRNGQNWARITLTILGGLGILFGLIGLIGIGLLFSLGIFGVIQGLFNIIQLALIIGALVFMFKPDANHYFKAS
nr:hypothetical protein GCM10017745_11050 [Saccharothrix mutabilis subsp. capreolus]